jgi:hypothetical protein
MKIASAEPTINFFAGFINQVMRVIQKKTEILKILITLKKRVWVS